MKNYAKPIQLISTSNLEIRAMIRYADMEALFPVCVHGLPNVLDEEMREALQTLICKCLNPVRSIWTFNEMQNENKD
jgi:hypothetical protein